MKWARLIPALLLICFEERVLQFRENAGRSKVRPCQLRGLVARWPEAGDGQRAKTSRRSQSTRTTFSLVFGCASFCLLDAVDFCVFV